MAITLEENYIKNVAILEADVISLWKDVLQYVKRDLAYIWTKQVKRDFKAMENDIEKILAILESLNAHYKSKDKSNYSKEIKNILILILKLRHIEASRACINEVYQNLK